MRLKGSDFMCKRFEEWSPQIKDYCIKNGYSFEKAKESPQCWGKNDLLLLHDDPEKGRMGLLDETPMPVVLWIKNTPEGLKFEQTEHTKKYLM
jgi:hypothetical protein